MITAQATTDTIQLPILPGIPGLAVRPFAAPDDCAARCEGLGFEVSSRAAAYRRPLLG